MRASGRTYKHCVTKFFMAAVTLNYDLRDAYPSQRSRRFAGNSQCPVKSDHRNVGWPIVVLNFNAVAHLVDVVADKTSSLSAYQETATQDEK
jgi:hypothetical protein